MLRLENDLFRPFETSFENQCKIYDIILPKTDEINSSYVLKSKLCDYQFIGIIMICKQLEEKNIDIIKFAVELLKNVEAYRNELYTFNDMFSCVISEKGFVNITVNNNYVSYLFKNVSQISQPRHNNCLIDYSSPNIAKELHVGHLRSTILGESTARIKEYFGNTVLRINHIGDWGVQFGRIMAYLEKNPSYNLADLTISDLAHIYVEASKLFNSDDEFKLKSREYVKLLQNEDEKTINIWKKICQISRNDYNKIYQMLNTTNLQEIGESFYNRFIPQIINELKENNVISLSNGAWIFVNGDHHLILVKSDGGHTYDTTDVVALWYRTQIMKVDEIIYFTDSGQKTHFDSVFKIGEIMKWTIGKSIKHIGFGLVKTDGKKITSRDTNGTKSVRLKDLLNLAIEKSRELCIMRNNVDTGCDDIGINSIKYFDLLHAYNNNYDFDENQMCSLNGNTAMYVMYTYARIKNIFKKCTSYDDKCIFIPTVNIEKTIALQTLEFENILNYVYNTLYFHKLIAYIYELSTKVNNFLTNKSLHIIGSEQQNSRLKLCKRIQEIYEITFHILGLKLLDHV
jgi:arginyl-tRNA synthetase